MLRPFGFFFGVTAHQPTTVATWQNFVLLQTFQHILAMLTKYHAVLLLVEKYAQGRNFFGAVAHKCTGTPERNQMVWTLSIILFITISYKILYYKPWIQVKLFLFERCNFQHRMVSIIVGTFQIFVSHWKFGFLTTTKFFVDCLLVGRIINQRSFGNGKFWFRVLIRTIITLENVDINVSFCFVIFCFGHLQCL